VAVGTDDDQARLPLIRRLHNRLPGRRALDRQRHRAEASRLGQRCAVLSGQLGGVPDVVGARGVELHAGLWHESDAECAPDREHNRIAPGGQLLAGLGDRPSGQVGAVVREQHRPGTVAMLADRVPKRPARERRGEPAAALPGRDDGCGRCGERRHGLPADPSQQRRGVPGWVLATHPAGEHWRGQTGPAEQVEQNTSKRAARGKAEADPQRGVHGGGRQAGQRRAEMQQDRHDHERGNRAQQLEDREHALYRGRAK
jgi:hypothetical protein